MAYRNVDISITKRGDNYDVKVTGPAGMASSHFTLPFQPEELTKFIVEMGATRRPIRRNDTPQMRAVRSFGGRLYRALLTDESHARFKSALDQIHLQGDKACIRLHLLDAPELMNLPWEYLYDPNADAFLALSADTPIVRFVELAQPVLPLPTEYPLRILGMVSNPDGSLNLDLDTERRHMEEALLELRRRGMLEITWLPRATLEELQRTLRRQTFHIFHFLGHGAYDSNREEGALVFEDENRRPSLINATMLGALLRDHKTLRLAVLNACEGARTSEQDPFAGVAPAIVRTGLPVAIAMQFEVTDKAAIIFAREFYSSIADRLPVYAAVSEARKAILFSRNDVEWGTPVVFSRVNDGVVFQLPPPPPPPPPGICDEMYQQMIDLTHVGKWQEILEIWERLKVLCPENSNGRGVADFAKRNQEADKLYRQMAGLVVSHQWEAALALWQQIQQLVPGYPDTEKSAERAKTGSDRQRQLTAFYSELGGLVSIGEWKKAQQKWNEITKIDSDWHDVHNYVARIREGLTTNNPQPNYIQLRFVISVAIMVAIGIVVWRTNPLHLLPDSASEPPTTTSMSLTRSADAAIAVAHTPIPTQTPEPLPVTPTSIPIPTATPLPVVHPEATTTDEAKATSQAAETATYVANVKAKQTDEAIQATQATATHESEIQLTREAKNVTATAEAVETQNASKPIDIQTPPTPLPTFMCPVMPNVGWLNVPSFWYGPFVDRFGFQYTISHDNRQIYTWDLRFGYRTWPDPIVSGLRNNWLPLPGTPFSICVDTTGNVLAVFTP